MVDRERYDPIPQGMKRQIEPSSDEKRKNEDIVRGFGEAPEGRLEVRLATIPNVDAGLVIRASGVIDSGNDLLLRDRVGKAIESGWRRIALDLSAVTRGGDVLLGCLVSILRGVKAEGGELVLQGVQPPLFEVMRLLGFTGFFTFTRTTEESAALWRHRTERAAFPRVVACPACARKQRATHAGRFRCRYCRAILVVRPGGGRSAPRPAAEDRQPRRTAGAGDLPPIQVFGQPELVDHLRRGGRHHTHLLSIGNPRSLFGVNRPDTRMPAIFRRQFRRVLRLSFYDVEQKRHLGPRQVPRRIPRREDVRRAIRFFRKTRGEASGYTLHCWQGISRSTAFALGYLFLLTGSEEEAARKLLEIRPQAGPHPLIVRWFDEELGCNLSRVNERIRDERLARWKRELDLSADALLEELPVSNDGD